MNVGPLPRQWLNKAAEDLAVARLIFREGHPGHVCFLSQQCMEKSLKAYLLVYRNKYPRTHKLVELLGQCDRLDANFAHFWPECQVVDQYYIPTRYPDALPGRLPEGLPGRAEAEEALAAAAKVLQFVRVCLQI